VTERLPEPDTTRFPVVRPEHVQILPAGTLVGRIYCQAGPFPYTWDEMRKYGPTTARFDHQPTPRGTHPTRAVMYVAPLWPSARGDVEPVLRTCMAECYQGSGVIELTRNTPYFVLYRLVADMRLLDVVDSSWVAEAGGNGAISSGSRARARQWARAIYRRYTGADEVAGIFSSSAIIPSARSVTLWERARPAIPGRPGLLLPLTHPALRAEIEHYADQLHLELIP